MSRVVNRRCHVVPVESVNVGIVFVLVSYYTGLLQNTARRETPDGSLSEEKNGLSGIVRIRIVASGTGTGACRTNGNRNPDCVVQLSADVATEDKPFEALTDSAD